MQFLRAIKARIAWGPSLLQPDRTFLVLPCKVPYLPRARCCYRADLLPSRLCEQSYSVQVLSTSSPDLAGFGKMQSNAVPRLKAFSEDVSDSSYAILASPKPQHD